MKCNICDRDLSDNEIVWNKEGGKVPGSGAYEPCSTCLDSAFDAAFTDGFIRGDPEEFTELEDAFVPGETEILEGAFEPEQLQMSFFPVDSYD